ncbi:unnamed protein product [Boreogadus saida]
MNLSGSDKVVLKSSMNGARFLNMTENDVLKFPKLHAPLISKICSEMNKKDGGRGLFNKKTTTPKFPEPVNLPTETTDGNPGWDDDEFSDDDYEDPDRDLGDEEGSGGDYESPTEDQEDNDYEPNPSEGPEDFSQVVRASKPVDEGEYIDNISNHAASRGPPPSPSPRPFTPPTHLAPSNQVSSLERREKSPGRAMGPAAPRPPTVERSKKPTRERGQSLSPVLGARINSMERPITNSVSTQERTPKPPAWSNKLGPPGSSASVGRSTSVKPLSGRFPSEMRRECRLRGTTPSRSRQREYPLGRASLASPRASQTASPMAFQRAFHNPSIIPAQRACPLAGALPVWDGARIPPPLDQARWWSRHTATLRSITRTWILLVLTQSQQDGGWDPNSTVGLSTNARQSLLGSALSLMPER